MVCMKNTKRTRSLWLMVAPIILLLAAPHQVNAQKAPPDDTKFLNLLVGTVQSRVMSTSGTRFEVNATGIELAEYLLTSSKYRTNAVKEAKAACSKLNAAAKKGKKAIEDEATKIGTNKGRVDLGVLLDLESETGFDEDDKFSMGVVIGIIASVSTIVGIQTYCPKHSAQAAGIVKAWTAVVTS